ncbi:MAG TPA: PKD domain-containing protein [Thermoanaerobaculia bacterium]|nr:PKD domain-containing protein [Thermoanaerobaculia bacterium]
MRRLFFAVGAVLLSVGAAGPAAGQCSLVTGPTAITCPDLGSDGCWGNLRLHPDSVTLYTNGVGGQDRVMFPLNYGHVVYSLSNPASPAYLAVGDIRLPPVGPIGGDGQTFIAGVGASGDGQRALLTMDVTNTGGTQVAKPSPAAFLPAASTGVYRSNRGLIVQKNGSRYIAYGLNSGGNLWVSDVTTLPGAYGSITYEAGFSGLTSGASAMRLAEGNGFQYIYWTRNGSIVLADASSPGPAGSITALMPAWTIPLGDWGRPAGDTLKSASLAVDPQSSQGNAYILGAFESSSGDVGFSLLKFNRTSQSWLPKVGDFTPDLGYTVNPGGRLVHAAYNSYSNDVDIFMWTSAAGPTSNGPKGILRLYATSARNFGAQISQTVDFDKNLPGTPQIANDMAFLRKSANDVYAYIVDTTVAVAVRMNCQSGPAPASGHLAVTNTSTGTTLGSGDVVFVGDTLKITPSITPPNSIEAMDNWNLDLDYHAATETLSSGYFNLKHPDACYALCSNPYPSNPDPPQFTMKGPCDPFAGGNPPSGAGCWSSVVSSGDFPAAPAAGATHTQSIGFEARNVDPGTTQPVPLATFAVTWKVPVVKVQNLAALLNVSNQATFTSASEGHPLGTAFKWYFGIDPAAPSSETLNQDFGCTGSSCQHPFTAGKGTYNAWLTATYPGEYVSPDCGPSPCSLPMTGSFKVNVTDFVAAFTAPSTAFIGGSPIHVTNQSTFGSGITPTYSYNLCDATSGSCSAGSYVALTGAGPWDITVPSPAATYWLRIRATYTPGPYADWLPNVVSDPTAWPITVNNTPPSVSVTVNPNPANVNSAVAFTATPSNFPGSVTSSSYSWNFGDGGTQSGGASASHTYTLSGNYTVRCTVTDDASNQAVGIRVVIVNGAVQPPDPLSVSVTANPNSTTPNTSVSLTAFASGGSGSYTIYTWDFGDGSPLSPLTIPSTTHPYAAVGTYHPSCTVRDSGGNQATGSTTVTVSTTGNPSCTLTSIYVYVSGILVGTSGGGAVSVSAGSPVLLAPQGTGGSSWSWNFGDGSPVDGTNSLKNPTHTYASPGTYTAQVVGDGGACTASVTLIVTGVAVTPDFKLGEPGGTDAPLGTDGSYLAPVGQQVTFRAVNAANGQTLPASTSATWDFSDGTPWVTGVTVPKTWPNQGSFPVKLTVPGKSPVLHQVNVVGGIPTAAYDFSYSNNGQPGAPVDPNKVSPGAGILFRSTGPPGAEYYWDFGDGTPCTSATPLSDLCRLSVTAHGYPGTGAYTVVLTVKLGGNTFRSPAPTTFHVTEPPRWVLPGLTYTSGQVSGTLNTSDVLIQNTSALGWAAFSVALLDGQDPPAWKPLPYFQPLESRRMTNVLSSIFGKSAGGPNDPSVAMLVRGDSVPPDGDPSIWAFSLNSNASDPSRGTYGAAFQAVPVSTAVGSTTPGANREFPGLRDVPAGSSSSLPPAYTNIGFANLGNIPATVNISFLTRTSGPVIFGNTFPLTVGPNRSMEMAKALRPALVGTGQPYETFLAESYYMLFEVVEAGARVVPYASVTDATSGDPMFLTPPPVGESPVRVPFVVRNSSTGEKTRSRLFIFNTSGQSRKVSLTLSYRRCAAGQACSDRAETSLTPTLDSGGTIHTEDLVHDWFANLGASINETDIYKDGYVDVAPGDSNTDPLIVRGEIYNSQPNGNFGAPVPGLVPALHAATAGSARTRLTLPYVVPQSGQSGYRTSVAFVALGDTSEPAQATVTLHQPYVGVGYPLAEDRAITVDDKVLQLSLEELFPSLASFPAYPWGYYSLEIRVTSGTLAAFSLVGDMVSSDANLIVARPLP